MRIGEKDISPPFDFWVPDFTDFTLPFKPGGHPYRDPADYEAYLNWLVVYMDGNEFPLNAQHQEIISDPAIQDGEADHLGLWFGTASISQYYFFVEPKFEYPEDFLKDPRPERVCDPAVVEWDSRCMDQETDEMHEGMVDLQTWLIFDCMCWEAEKEYDEKLALLPEGTAVFSDIGWRPLLKFAISKTDDWWVKKKALKRFHEEYGYLSMK